jgi:hypothetical protein
MKYGGIMSAIKGTLSLLAAFALLQADVSAEQKLGQSPSTTTEP